MEDELKMVEIKDPQPFKTDSQLNDLSDKDLENLIIQAQANQDNTAEIIQPKNTGVDEPTVPVPQKSTEPEKPEEPKSGEKQKIDGQVETNKVDGQPEQVKEDAGQVLSELEKKKGKKLTPEDVAKMYVDLEKEFHKRAQADSLNRHPVNTQSNNVYQEDPKEQFLKDFTEDPLATLGKVLSVVNKPIIENQNRINLDKEIIRLSNSPKTMDFTEPEIQEEIKNILNEKPYLQNDLVNNLEFVYQAAKGRVLSKNPNVENQLNPSNQVVTSNKKAAVVESSSRRLPPKPFNAWTSPLDEVEKQIQEMQNSLR